MAGKRRKIIWIVVGIVLSIVGTWWGMRWYEGYQFDKKWEMVKPGMTKAEVERILGKPAGIESGWDSFGGGGYNDTWVYGWPYCFELSSQSPYVFGFNSRHMPEVYFSKDAEGGKVEKKSKYGG